MNEARVKHAVEYRSLNYFQPLRVEKKFCDEISSRRQFELQQLLH